jgi:hypothetical protein
MKDCIYVDPTTNLYVDDFLEPSQNNVMIYDSSIVHPVSGHIGSWINSNKLILEDFETKSILIKDSQPNKSSVNLTLYNRSQINSGYNNYTGAGTSIYFNAYTINNNILGHTVASIESEHKVINDFDNYYTDLVFKIGASERMRMNENSTLINYINMNNTDIVNAHAIYPTDLYVNNLYEKSPANNIKFNNILDANNNKIINVGTPTNGGDAINKQFFDLQTIKGALTKKNVDIATTTNILLTGEQLIDGITTNLTRILVKDQTSQTENGIYNTNTGAWTRSDDLDNAPSAEIFNGVWTYIVLGTINTGFSYRITSQGTGLNELHQIGIDNITWGLSNINFQVTAPITTNLKITLNQLNTIQDITTTSNVTFNQTTTVNTYTDNIFEKTALNNIVFHNDLDITGFNIIGLDSSTIDDIYVNNIYEKTLNHRIVLKDPIKVGHIHELISLEGVNIHNAVNMNNQDINDINNLYSSTLTVDGLYEQIIGANINVYDGMNYHNNSIINVNDTATNSIHLYDIYRIGSSLLNINVRNTLDMMTKDIINITNCTTSILNTDTINAKNLTIGSIITVNNDLNMSGNDITGINVLKTTDLYVEHIYPKGIATLLINIYQDLHLQTHDINAVKKIKLQSIEHVTGGAIIDFLSKIKLSATVAGTPTRYLGLSASNEVITMTPNLILIADLDFYATYKIINLLKLNFTVTPYVEVYDFITDPPPWMMNLIDYYTAVPNTVGMGLKTGSILQYISTSHEFYIANALSTRITSTGLHIAGNNKTLSFQNSTGTAGSISKIQFLSGYYSSGIGCNVFSVDYVQIHTTLFMLAVLHQ